jgi:hypothetical protein
LAELTWRGRAPAPTAPRADGNDLWWLAGVGGLSVLVLAFLLTVSVQGAVAFVLLVAVIALYAHDRRFGIIAVFGLWFLAPGLRRVLGANFGFAGNDPLSVAPFLATAALAGLELTRARLPRPVSRPLLLAAAGFTIGLPVGLFADPQSAMYAFGAYVAAVAGGILGAREGPLVRDSSLRWALLYGMLPVAAYALVQRLFDLPSWDQAWLDTTELVSLGVEEGGAIRVFSSLNSPGVLAPLLTLSLLTYLTLERARPLAISGAVLVTIALSLTFVRSAWVSLLVGGIAHVVASGGRSARVVFTAAAVVTVVTIGLSPVSDTARSVIDRFETIGSPSEDGSVSNRSATLSENLPSAAAAPLGHGLGTAGESARLSVEQDLRIPDNGYLSLVQQVGPIGSLLVLAAIGFVLRAAWQGARWRAPGQEMRVLVFAMLVALLAQLYAGDSFYGVQGVIFWFLAGQALMAAFRLRAESAPPVPPSASA